MNAQDEAGWTPLHIAVSCGHDEVVRCLLAHEADVHARTENGLTALHYAASKNRLEVFNFNLFSLISFFLVSAQKFWWREERMGWLWTPV